MFNLFFIQQNIKLRYNIRLCFCDLTENCNQNYLFARNTTFRCMKKKLCKAFPSKFVNERIIWLNSLRAFQIPQQKFHYSPCNIYQKVIIIQMCQVYNKIFHVNFSSQYSIYSLRSNLAPHCRSEYILLCFTL